MRPSFFLTTPIYYVNDVPHIGHAYTTIAADTLARYKRMSGHDVLFLTGTDEHGQKIEKAAEARGETAQQLADRLSAGFKALWTDLEITNDDFVRTTEPRHKKAVYEVFRRMQAAGDIYEDEYEGLYCVPCESFWTELQLVEGHCPDCGRDVEKVTESSYFFKLSTYGDKLLTHIEAHPEFISPKSRANEVKQFIKMDGGLRDLSISRTGVKWGIPLPDDDAHVFYVWLDALVNYLTATGFPDDGWERRWPAQAHLIGKDILRFHAIYWPAFLMSAGLPLPKRIISHGWWTIDGEKMSKSRGNVIDPKKVADHFGVDAMRYFLLREVTFGKDGNFSIEAMTTRYNADLANNLGNLLSRTVSMTHRYRDGVVPKAETADDAQVTVIRDKLAQLPAMFTKALDDPDKKGRGLAFEVALEALWDVLSDANAYIHETAPWELAKSGDDTTLDTVLYNALETVRICSLYLWPVMPATSEAIWKQLAIHIDPNTLDLEQQAAWGGLPPGSTLSEPAALFPRKKFEDVPADLQVVVKNHQLPEKKPDKKTRKETANVSTESGEAATPGEKPDADDFISIHDFAKVRLQVGRVKEAEPIPKAKKLLKLQVDIGTETRQIVAGIARQYPPEEMVGKQVVVVTNLRPAQLMGVTSEGMLLAAGDAEVLALLTPSQEVEPGTRIK
ncbi:MAG: methionine--tRNA ligase [Leptospirillia bacterium]